MRKYLLSFVFLLLAGSAFTQSPSTVFGVVRQAGVPVENAEVAVFGENDIKVIQSAVSGPDGRFAFDLSPGRYRIAATKGKGRFAVRSPNQTIDVAPGQTVTVELALSLTASINESVTVSADQRQPIDEVSKTVNTITGQEMRDRADFALADTLRTIPGFRVQQLGGFGRTATIKTRGLRNQDTAVLIDGVRLRDPSAITGDASPFIGDITLTSVSRVEVLRGSGSSLYGTNAIGGTVDFQTPMPQSGPHGQLSYAAGGLGLHRFRGNFTDGTKDGKFGFNIAAARTVYTEGIDGEDDAHNTNFQSRLEYNPSARTNLSARFFVSDAYVRLNSSPDTLGDLPLSNTDIIEAKPGVSFLPDQNDPLANQKSKFFNGQLAFSQVINPRASLRAYYSGLKTSRKNDNSGVSLSVFDGTINTANATLNWAPNGVHDVKVGYEFEHEAFGNEGLTPDGAGNFFSRASQSSNTLFVQDVLSLFEGRLQLAGGFRAQFFRLDDPEFSLMNAPYANLSLEDPPAAYTFDAAASYYFQNTGTKLRAHVGNGYRVPSLYERYGTFFSTFFGPEFIALGDPRLKPERSIAFDAGIEQYLAGEKVKLTAVYFYTELTDTIGYGNVVDDVGPTLRPFGGYINQKGGIARGGGFSGTVKPIGSTEVFASYTFTNSDQLVPQISGSGVVETLGIPKHQFTLVATQRINRFWINADLLATSDYLAPIFSNSTFNSYVYRFDGNRRIDLTAGYTFPLNKDRFSLRVFGTVENLLDQEYYENGFKTPGRNGRAGLSFGF
jgi:iron complex outermembrane receptor protein